MKSRSTVKTFDQLQINDVFHYDGLDYVKMREQMIVINNRFRIVNACPLHSRDLKYFSHDRKVEKIED